MTQGIFWALLAAGAFAFLLAVQMRFMISHAFRRALAAKFGGEMASLEYRQVIAGLGHSLAATPEARHIEAIYQSAVSHLLLARKVSIVAPVACAAILLIGRAYFGAF